MAGPEPESGTEKIDHGIPSFKHSSIPAVWHAGSLACWHPTTQIASFTDSFASVAVLDAMTHSASMPDCLKAGMLESWHARKPTCLHVWAPVCETML